MHCYYNQMRVQDVIKAPKKITNWGKAEEGPMGPSVFPMSKRKRNSYRLGTVYRWRLIKFQALNRDFRLLIAYHTQIDKYLSLLGEEVEGDLKLLAEFSYDPSHCGWHVHATCGDISDVPLGVMKGPWQRRIPTARGFHRRTAYTPSGNEMTDNTALQIAVDRFNLVLEEGSLFDKRSTGYGI